MQITTMARTKIEIPDQLIATLNIPVRITDINYGDHVGNDAFVAIIHEARMQWLQQPRLKGLNITIPHKQAVLSFLDDSTNIPFGLNACNCIRIIDEKLVGYNTDVIGFERSLLSQLNKHHTRALILGNGGASEAVKFVLQQLNINYKIVSRKIHKDAELTYADLNETIIKENRLIINTTPVGTFPVVDGCPEIPYQYLTPQHFLYDLVYNPEKTLFLKKGEEHGALIKNGYEMLVIQAEESWDIWNGIL